MARRRKPHPVPDPGPAQPPRDLSAADLELILPLVRAMARRQADEDFDARLADSMAAGNPGDIAA